MSDTVYTDNSVFSGYMYEITVRQFYCPQQVPTQILGRSQHEVRDDNFLRRLSQTDKKKLLKTRSRKLESYKYMLYTNIEREKEDQNPIARFVKILDRNHESKERQVLVKLKRKKGETCFVKKIIHSRRRYPTALREQTSMTTAVAAVAGSDHRCPFYS